MDRDMLDQILASRTPTKTTPSTGGTHDPPAVASETDPPAGVLLDLDLLPYERLIDRDRMHPNNRDLPWIKELEAMEDELMEVLAGLQPHLRERFRNDLNTQP